MSAAQAVLSNRLLHAPPEVSRPVQGWKVWLMDWVDSVLFRLPFVSEFVNQGMSKNFGILAGWHLVSRIDVEGDYLEFGVFRGQTFRNAMWAAKKTFATSPMKAFRGRFFAFDSFEGLPDTECMKEKTNIYRPGEFSASRQTFETTIAKTRNLFPVEVTEGWFDKTLTPETAASLKIEKIAFANVDCDLYESTVPVLKFITPYLQTGTVIYFDDWYSIKGCMNSGEPRACREWLEANPHIKLVEYRNVGVTGKMFVVNIL